MIAEKKLIAHGLAPETASSLIFPQPPTLSSQKAAWNGIYLEYHHQPAYETPDYCYKWHVLGIHIGRPVTIEMQWGRRLVRKSVMDGEVYLFPANVRHVIYSDRQSEFIDLHLEPAMLTRAAYELLVVERVEFVPYFATRDPLIQQIALALKAELESTSSEHLYAELMANALAVHLLRRYTGTTILERPTEGLPQYKLRQVLDYIHDHLEQDLGVEAIATLLQMSPYYFSRLFKQSTGLSPHQYIIQGRVDRAKQLLNQGEMAIADIAYSVGFTSQSHLNRHFKRLVGVTPKAFLRK